MKDTNRELVKNVLDDFEIRKEARKNLELGWQLNMDFYKGLQNNYVTNMDIVAVGGKRYYWQQREVFNHIGALVESRLAKLAGAKSDVAVVPLSDTDKDVKCAEKCEKVIKAVFKRLNMKSLVDQANMWAEMTGTGFYKVVWDNNSGRELGDINGAPVRDGDVKIVVCSPFEIYPDNLHAGDVDQLSSIIHAKPYTVEMIQKTWGVSVAGTDIEVHGKGTLKDAAMVIERYKDGELVIVAGDRLLYRGAYNMAPFVRQTSESSPGCFYGRSVIERAIPVQRAYNAVKNRKSEFLNRLACGVLSVQEGSVDVEALENDGLAPGAIITYKQGMDAPTFMSGGIVPESLEREEERLLSELATITGGLDISRGHIGNVSGIALEIMVEQDRLRIKRAIESAQNARVLVATKVLQLYKQYASVARIERLTKGKLVEIFTFSNKDITSDEVEIEENE
ncbi:MAG: hypothetical protein LBG88_03810 [Christensenellaceae bacterium]|jgi:hypothetical protein|nr:hypothetical protein [Christensenellaceae bacterium]